MRRYFAIVSSLFLFCGCNVRYYATPEGGFRLYDSAKFKYNKPEYKRMNKSAIDTSCIYVMDSTFNKWDDVKIKKEGYRFIRFFSRGQVLFIYNKGMPDLKMINNKNIGIPGYYYIEERRIKISMFKNINGGLVVDYLGEIDLSGNLIFYEQPTGKSLLLETKGYNGKSFWSKVKIEKMEYYKPDW